jgi:hypothetical protein
VEGRCQRVDQGPTPQGGTARGAPPGPPLSLLWTPSRVGEIGTSGFVSSNSENISYVTFLKQKNYRKQELALWHLVNRLVPKKCIKMPRSVNKTQSNWCKNKHGASKIIDTFATYQCLSTIQVNDKLKG